MKERWPRSGRSSAKVEGGRSPTSLRTAAQLIWVKLSAPLFFYLPYFFFYFFFYFFYHSMGVLVDATHGKLWRITALTRCRTRGPSVYDPPATTCVTGYQSVTPTRSNNSFRFLSSSRLFLTCCSPSRLPTASCQ